MTSRAFVGFVAAVAASLCAPAAWAGCTAQKIELPVSMSPMGPLTTAMIDGRKVSLVVDSGSFFGLLDSKAASALQLKTAPSGQLVWRSVGSETRVDITVVQDFRLADTRLGKFEFLVTPYSGGAVAGALGQNVLSVGDVRYDFPDGVMQLFVLNGCGDVGPSLLGGPMTGALEIEAVAGSSWQTGSIIRQSSGRFRTVGVVKVNGQPLRAIFDTGARTSVISRGAAARLGVRITDPGTAPAGLAYGVDGKAKDVFVAPFAVVDIGGEQIKNTTLRVAELGLEDADMLIGADFFLAHKVYVSNNTRRLYLSYVGGPVFKLPSPGAPATR